jgi:2-oxoglutarate dehydrogenase E1 component
VGTAAGDDARIPFDAIARANPDYLESLYQQYRRDPSSVPEPWALVFAGYDLSGRPAPTPARSSGSAPPETADLVHSYRELGHLVADLDPLERTPCSHPLLALEGFGFTEADLDRTVDATPFQDLERATLRDLVAALRETYCGTLGIEYMHIADKAPRAWLQERMEPARNRPALTDEERADLLARLVRAEAFEQFLHTKYLGQKRFSLEGCEALVPLLDAVVEEVATLEADELVLGMAHRGRLNVLAHVLRKPYELILAEFEGTLLPSDVQGDGDVKYHLGYSHDHVTRGRRAVHLSLASNPSHLEAVNSVVEGIVRAKQSYRDDIERKRVVPVLLHGDAAFMGQGSVYETLILAPLPGFTTGGTVHIIVNNQLGFTTSPEDFRASRYPSDLGKAFDAPIFHVNGDDPEAVVQAARLAAGYRQAFGRDVLIDLVCYRRYGHNELDDPTFTQPTLYQKIRKHPSVAELYRHRLVEGGAVEDAAVEAMQEAVRGELDTARAAARAHMPRLKVQAFGGVWTGLGWAGEDWSADTRVKRDTLRSIAEAARRLPADFSPHPRVAKLLEARRAMVERGEGIDWGCAEHLAYGSLLVERLPVRLSGQDSVRGTFSHRHGTLFDTKTGAPYIPLDHLGPEQASIELVNSPLSEVGVVGFEYGMASADPRRLVVWEAQFGDFANGAQVIVDQFIASAESKWQRMSGLTLLLPHGYEGQGPEHSSARVERFLSLCADDNLQVVNCTTPAQFFHVLRRQMHRAFRKPLIVMHPKSLLRHPAAVSSLAELADGTFQPVLQDPGELDPADVRRVLLCSGKIFYALDEGRAERDARTVTVLRLEQLYPFPAAELAAALRRYPVASQFRWVQEEPSNQGPWSFVRWRIEELLGAGVRLRYVGRKEAASPATGSYKMHQAEETAIIEAALTRSRKARRHPAADDGGQRSRNR